ncbi:MAG: hypothetical protein COV76_07795 [Candidatus Omnitrophica bacterium CG11_big_fil_rev_8_21_14_0_20_64_10]|nr:MAG: hypothetical protein COV76_07795 [Candidatus Omnitrophica bacterium CG11_big_fil_rev_8_21_14_0_20_64_10]
MSSAVGQRLRGSREKKGISIEEAAAFTKIQHTTLEAIEAGRIGQTLAPTYARIFVKKYADYLGLDGDAIAKEYGLTPEAAPAVSVETAPVPEKVPAAVTGWQWLLPGVIALIGLIAMGTIGRAVLGRMSRPVTAPVGIQRDGAPASAPAANASNKPLLVKPGRELQLTITAVSDVWMRVKSDGRVLFQNVLKKGAKESWTARDEFEIWTGNASGMRVTLNGRDLGAPGRGVIKNLKVTRRGVELP